MSTNDTESRTLTNDELGAGIVEISRKARFADTTPEEWGQRLVTLIAAQPEVRGSVQVSNVRQVGTAAGGSNGTLLFDATYDSDNGVQQKNLVLRFLPIKGLFRSYDVTAQFGIQKALENTNVPVPPQLWLDAEGKYLQRPGYVMAQVPGVSTPMAWMTTGLIAEAAVGDRRAMTTAYVHTLAKLHSVDWRRLGLEWLEQRAKGTRPIEREVNWYWDSLVWADSKEDIENLAPIRDWLIANEPTDVDIVVCHGDANYGNYMFVGTEVTAVVDWEMAFLGTPECDLTFMRAGDAIMGGNTPRPEGALSHDEMEAEYERFSGKKLKHLDYFKLFSQYRLAVINVLAQKHFPPEVLPAFLPILRLGPQLCIANAREMGVIK